MKLARTKIDKRLINRNIARTYAETESIFVVKPNRKFKWCNSRVTATRMILVVNRFTLRISTLCTGSNLIPFPAPLRRTRPLVTFSVIFRGMSSIEYPETRRGDLVEDLHGVKVSDPYRYLEDPKSPETTVFISSTSSLILGLYYCSEHSL